MAKLSATVSLTVLEAPWYRALPVISELYRQQVEMSRTNRRSIVGGWSMVEQLSWNNYNEGGDLVRDSERYRERYGSYPASVHADKHRARRKQIREDESIRNAVEGRFGVARRHYSLDRVMARLAESSQTVAGIVFLVMNLERWFLVPFSRLVKWFCSELRYPAVARRETAADRIGRILL